MSDQVTDGSWPPGRRGAPSPGPRSGDPAHSGASRTPRRLVWFAEVPARRRRQLLVDLVVGGWCVLWVLVGLAVHRSVSSLAAPALALADGTERTAAELRQAGQQVADVPLVGERAAAPFGAGADAVAGLTQGSTALAEQVQDLAVLVGVLVPLAPVCFVLVLWLPSRLRAARRAGAARAMLDAGAGPGLFALRALATQPLDRLGAVSSDPAGDWRRGEPAVVAELAALELARLGLRVPAGR